jgi:hypothetical protein
MFSGNYNYYLNDQPSGVTEEFKFEIADDGSRVTTAERAAAAYGTKILLSATDRDGYFSSIDIKFINQNKKSPLEVLASYKFSGRNLLFDRSVNGKAELQRTIQLPKYSLVFPLMRCFQGQVILRAAESNQTVPVLIPFIEDSNDADQLLTPTFDQRTAELIRKENIFVGDAPQQPYETNVYRYLGKHYDETAEFWIEPDGLLVQYRFPQNDETNWLVRLSAR